MTCFKNVYSLFIIENYIIIIIIFPAFKKKKIMGFLTANNYTENFIN